MTFRLFLTAHRRKVVAAGLGTLVLGTVIAAAVTLRGLDEPGFAQVPNGETGARAASLGVGNGGEEILLDSDLDDLPDAVENYVYGSDPDAWSTGGNGIPDGWLAKHDFDPTEPGIGTRLAAIPPDARLPDVYDGEWPIKYSWTLRDAYLAGRPAGWSEATDGPWNGGVDPTQWAASGSDIPYAWLHHYGLDLRDAAIGLQRSGSDSLTIGEKFDSDTNPTMADSDADGLTDSDEMRLYKTDPRDPSTSGTGIPDGWLVRYRLDPTDRAVGSQDPGGKGMSVLATFEYNLGRFGLASTLEGHGLDPLRASTLERAIPDGWLVRNGLDPLAEGLQDRPLQRASEFGQIRDMETGPEGMEALGDLTLTLLNAYTFGRPANWSEASAGPWFGGLNPNRTDNDEDGLPDVVELRGWYATRIAGLGPAAVPEWYVAQSNPTNPDTDGDGLTDAEEYFGKATRGTAEYRWLASDPSNEDTAFSGLGDAEKVFGSVVDETTRVELVRSGEGGVRVPLLEPVRTDSDGDYLADGPELRSWLQSVNSSASPYSVRFAGSRHVSHDSWLRDMPGARGQALAVDDVAELLGPGGDVDGDGLANVIDADADGDGLLDGWEVVPDLLRFSTFSTEGPRGPTDPANPDTDADGLRDDWELRYGAWDAARRFWDLDPSKYSSAGGESDGLRNLDEDIVSWTAMQGPPSDRIPEARTFKFNNLMEQTKGTNPRVADENGDGVAESWAVFWHDVYPLRVRDAVRGDQEAADEVGTLVPTEVEIVSIREALANPLGDLGGHVKANLHYVRFFEVLGTPASARSQLRPGETLAIDPPLTIQVLRDGFRVPAVVAEASGSKAHGFADDEQLGLNPYLLDTDGDGLSDAWEAFAGRCSGVGGTNPIAPDATDDPEGDGLENAGEQESGTSPCSADTDLGGVADGVEVGVQGLSALEPGDDASPQEDRPDDGDRLPLDEELRLGTDPNDPDSDQDGLLDGDDVEFLLSTLDDETGPLVAHLLARGVASERLEGGSAGPKVRFLGEAPNRGDPRGLDTSGDGIPDGWLAYYTGRADVPRSELMARYECGRPAWWDESRVGVWWWGAPPLAPEGCHGDMDYDGLLDNTGEDPIPASSHGNLLPPGVPRLPYDLTPSLSGIELLVAGQRQGECAGDPRPCRSEWPARSYFGDRPDAQDRAPVEFSEVDTSLATAPDGLLRMGKEEEFQVRGRLGLACGTPCDGAPGLSNRTVVAELVDSSGSARTLGVGFTGPSGRFEIRSCLCLSGAAEVPYPDVVALGQSSGRVEWTSDPRNVEVGSLPLLTIRSYATTATFYSGTRPNASHPQYVELDIGAETYHATASAGHSVGTVHITSGTALAIDTPQTIPFTDGGRTLTVGVSLVDRSGAGVPFQRVAVEAVGIGMTNPTTGASGTAVATFQIPPARVASVIVRATYSGDSVAGLGPAAPAGPASVELQAPLTLVVEAPGAPVRSGEVFATSVLVQSRGQPVEGIAVRAVIGSFAGEAMSGASGIAVFALQPTGFGGSVSHVTFDVEETLAYQGASVTIPLEVVAGVLLTATVPASIGEGNASKVLGRLTLLDGSPVSGETVRLTIGGSPAGIASTGQDGRWETVLLVPAGLGAGRASMQVEFGGRTGELEPAALSREIRVVVTTQITTPPVKGGQGGIVDIKGRLTDVSGRGVAGHWVLVDVDGHRQGTALTSSGGGFGFRYSIPGNSTVAVHLVKTTFDGSPNGTYGPSFTTTTLHVGAPTVLVLAPPSALLRGNNTLVATLRGPDDVPLTNAQVTFTSSTGGHVVSTTDPTGRAAPTFAFNPPTVGQAITIQAAFAGSTLQGPATDQATVPLRVPTRIIMSVDSEAGRGAPLRIRTVLLDDTDRRLLGETLSFSLLGTTVETASTDGEEVLMEVPREAPLGNSSLEVAYPGGEFLLEAAALRQIVIKEGARLAIGPLPRDVVADQAFEVRIRLTDSQGVPLVGRTVGVRMSHQSIAAIVTTGPDGNGTAILASPVAGAGSVVAFFPGEEFLAAQSATSDPLQIKASAAPSGSRATGLVMAFAALVMLVGGILVARVLLRRRASVLSILHAAERSISAGNPWSAAVLLAYRRLTVHLAGQGFRERPSESVREFVQELATRVALPTDAAIDLVRLFEAGRYGGMELDAGHARWARLALRRVIHAIESHVEVPPSGSDGGTVVP